MAEAKSPGWLRALEVIAGLFIILLAGIALDQPIFAIQTLVFIIAIGLLLTGLSRALVGVFGTLFSQSIRAANTAGGLIAVVLAAVTLIRPDILVGLLIIFLALALLVIGVAGITLGAFVKHPPAWLRGVVGAIGALNIALSVLVLLDPALGELTLAFILAIILVGVGVHNIAHGVTGHHFRRGTLRPSLSKLFQAASS